MNDNDLFVFYYFQLGNENGNDINSNRKRTCVL